MPFSVLPQLPRDPSDLFRQLAGWYIFCELNILRAGDEREKMFEAALADLNTHIADWWVWLKEKHSKEERDKQRK